MLINKSQFPQVLRIIGPDGKPDTINILKGSRVELPVGYQLDPNKAREYAAVLTDTNQSSGAVE